MSKRTRMPFAQVPLSVYAQVHLTAVDLRILGALKGLLYKGPERGFSEAKRVTQEKIATASGTRRNTVGTSLKRLEHQWGLVSSFRKGREARHYRLVDPDFVRFQDESFQAVVLTPEESLEVTKKLREVRDERKRSSDERKRASDVQKRSSDARETGDRSDIDLLQENQEHAASDDGLSPLETQDAADTGSRPPKAEHLCSTGGGYAPARFAHSPPSPSAPAPSVAPLPSEAAAGVGAPVSLSPDEQDNLNLLNSFDTDAEAEDLQVESEGDLQVSEGAEGDPLSVDDGGTPRQPERDEGAVQPPGPPAAPAEPWPPSALTWTSRKGKHNSVQVAPIRGHHHKDPKKKRIVWLTRWGPHHFSVGNLPVRVPTRVWQTAVDRVQRKDLVEQGLDEVASAPEAALALALGHRRDAKGPGLVVTIAKDVWSLGCSHTTFVPDDDPQPEWLVEKSPEVLERMQDQDWEISAQEAWDEIQDDRKLKWRIYRVPSGKYLGAGVAGVPVKGSELYVLKDDEHVRLARKFIADQEKKQKEDPKGHPMPTSCAEIDAFIDYFEALVEANEKSLGIDG